MHEKVAVLFVCMGNICRSPTAHGVFRRLVEERGLQHRIHVDSAGTHAYHVGDAPDPRAQKTALGRGIDLSDLRARRLAHGDYQRFDYLLAMDGENFQIMAQHCPPEHMKKLRMFMEFAPGLGIAEVPDPYYGGPSGFDRVLDMIEAAAEGLIEHIRERHL